MALNSKSYLINRKSDWLNYGIVDNFYFSDEKMRLSNTSGENGFYVSFAFDSMQQEAVWHRMRIRSCMPKNALMRVSVYASDSLKADIRINAVETKEIVIDDYLKDESIPLSERVHFFNKFSSTVQFDNCYDVPLFAAKGRYLWVAIEVANFENEDLYIESLRLDFPMDSFSEYLPEIYRKNSEPDSFFNRFLGLYQAVYDDISDEIANLPGFFARMDEGVLKWVIQWFSIKDDGIWDVCKLRQLLYKITHWYSIKGTKQAIKDIATFFVGSDVRVIEQYSIAQNDFYNDNKDCLQNLYGKNGYTFTVIVSSGGVKTSEQYISLLKLMNLFKPAETKCNLVVLNNNIYLDYHCYLGVNTYLSHNREMVINSDSVIMDSTFLSE